MTFPCLMLVTLGPGAMISDLDHLCYHYYIHVLDPILQFIVIQDLDVRGMRGDEALNAVQYFIDDAILVGMPRVRIIRRDRDGRTLIGG